MKKRVFGLLIILFFAICFANTVNVSAAKKYFAGGNGTKQRPYLVKTLKQLNNVRKFNGKYFKQVADIDGKGKKFKPLFTEYKPFTGVYDGGKYTISNMTISNRSIAGLFTSIDKKGKVKNIYISNFSIVGANGVHYGMVAGFNYGKITGCKAEESVIKSVGASQSGGICGGCNGGTVKSCSTKNIKIYGSDLGGIVGGAINSAMIQKCKSSNIELYATGSGSFAGATGGILGAGESCSVMDCLVSGKLTCSSSGYQGDIIGYDNGNTIIECDVDLDVE